MLYEVITKWRTTRHQKRICLVFTCGEVCVITSYSIHYTKLYEKALLEEDIVPDIIVSDLDGDMDSILKSNDS